KSTRLNSSHVEISYAVFCLKKKKWLFLLFNTSFCIVDTVKMQRHHTIGVDSSCVAAAAFDCLDISCAAHQAPSALNLGRTLVGCNQAHALPGQLFSVVQSVDFKSMYVKLAFHLLCESDR